MKQKKINGATIAAMQRFAHANSVVVDKRRRLLQFDLEQTRESIIALSAELSRQRRHEKDAIAEIDGLTTVIAARGGPA